MDNQGRKDITARKTETGSTIATATATLDMTQSGLRAQPGKPSGIVGRIVGYLMDIYNREDNHWTVSLLDIGETSKVLEIGFGTGLAIADAAKITTHGYVHGIELSETMLKVA